MLSQQVCRVQFYDQINVNFHHKVDHSVVVQVTPTRSTVALSSFSPIQPRRLISRDAFWFNARTTPSMRRIHAAPPPRALNPSFEINRRIFQPIVGTSDLLGSYQPRPSLDRYRDSSVYMSMIQLCPTLPLKTQKSKTFRLAAGPPSPVMQWQSPADPNNSTTRNRYPQPTPVRSFCFRLLCNSTQPFPASLGSVSERNDE